MSIFKDLINLDPEENKEQAIDAGLAIVGGIAAGVYIGLKRSFDRLPEQKKEEERKMREKWEDTKKWVDEK